MTYSVSRPQIGGRMFDRQGRRKYLNKQERRAFYEAANQCSDKFEKAFCLTLLFTGCRISEGLNLTLDRVDFSQRAVIFETLKQRKKGIFRSVPIPETLCELLAELAGHKKPSQRIWNWSRATASRLIADRMSAAGNSGAMACPKGLRHGFGVACVASKIPQCIIQRWLGHKRPETTAIYLNVVEDEERKLAQDTWFED